MFRPHLWLSALTIIACIVGSGASRCYSQDFDGQNSLAAPPEAGPAEEIGGLNEAYCVADTESDSGPNLNLASHMGQEGSLDWVEFSRLIERCSGTRTLLERLEFLHRTNQLRQLSDGNLPFSLIPISGWRWQVVTKKGGRVLMAVDGKLLVVIRENRRLEMSVKDLSGGRAVERGFAGSQRYFAHRGGSVRNISAISAKHLSDAHPQLFQIYFYFAGPTASITTIDSMPRSAVDFIVR